MCWVAMVFGSGGSLADTGLRSLKYFTVLSNFLAAIAAIVWLCAGRTRGGRTQSIEQPNTNLRVPSREEQGDPGSDDSSRAIAARSRKAELFKYVAAVSVFLTLMTVAVFLGPLYGYKSMFIGPNLPFHLLVPLAAILEVIFLTDHPFTRRDARLCLLPVVLYGVGYLANILINGIGEWPDRNDWYLFFLWGYPIGLAILGFLILVTCLLALFLQKMQRIVLKGSQPADLPRDNSQPPASEREHVASSTSREARP